jgi:hypothetical protein
VTPQSTVDPIVGSPEFNASLNQHHDLLMLGLLMLAAWAASRCR